MKSLVDKDLRVRYKRSVLGFLWFREPFSALKLVFLSMIVVGAVGLNLITRTH